MFERDSFWRDTGTDAFLWILQEIDQISVSIKYFRGSAESDFTL